MGISENTKYRIKRLYEAGYSCFEIAKSFGMPESVVRHIISK